jgi:tetratricopeptide (TPR) repeat protein
VKRAALLISLVIFPPVWPDTVLEQHIGTPGQHEHSAASTDVGRVSFSTSCRPEVASEFNRAVALLHSFWFPSAVEGFQKVLGADPRCAMAYWGIAMSVWGNPFGASRPAKALQEGRAAVDKARSLTAPERERAYIDAVAELYTDVESRDQRTRILAYEQAMERVAARYRDDPEARIFYALSLDQSALPTDKTYAKQLKAAAILEAEQPRQPDHPGITHYIIHTYDSPAFASRAIEAARRYASLAPAVAHALHMPSHTFTRLGYWQDSIDTNIASADAAARDNAPSEHLHALDYQVYAYLQTAQDKAARRVVERVPAVSDVMTPDSTVGAAAPYYAGLFAAAAIPARYALERGAWSEAASLVARKTDYPQTDAVTYFARALGAARTGHRARAWEDVATLASLQKALLESKEPYWADQVDIQRKVAEAWSLWADGQKQAALVFLREAAEQEDRTDKSAVTPGPLAPARELLGEMLLEAGDAAGALPAFEAAMKKEPNRFRALLGAARAAVLLARYDDARRYYRHLLEIARDADTERPEIREATDFEALNRF